MISFIRPVSNEKPVFVGGDINGNLNVTGTFSLNGAMGQSGGAVSMNTENGNYDFTYNDQAGNSLLFLDASAGNVGVGTATPALGGYSGTTLTVREATATSVLELSSAKTDADEAVIGQVVSYFEGNDATYKEGSWVRFFMDGSTDGQRGAAISFGVRADAATGTATEAMRIDSNGHVGIGGTASSLTQLLTVQTVDVSGGAVTDGYSAGYGTSPTYDGANTVTRHNYFNVVSPTLSGSAVVTDACLFRFPDNAGTHKALDAGTTKTTPTAVDGWIKINENGNVRYVPFYDSKTA